MQSTLQASTIPTETSNDAESETADGAIASEESSDQSGAGEGGSVRSEVRPDWLGKRVLPTIPDGSVVTPQTTPEELQDRRFATIDVLDPPIDEQFLSSSGSVPDDVLARSTWVEGCPVAVENLAYLTMSFWGFDDRVHTGEMIVHREVAEEVISVFASLFEDRFPIEEMTVVTPEALAAEPTGDGNNTTAFVCRAVTGGSRFSQHAFGLAIDINPFHNPYQRAELVLPELAGVYLDRSDARSGMILEDDPVVQAFDQIGWSWGGNWSSLKDYQHFSLNNR